MKAQQTMVDTIANNLANVNTNGFKRTQIDFQDRLSCRHNFIVFCACCRPTGETGVGIAGKDSEGDVGKLSPGITSEHNARQAKRTLPFSLVFGKRLRCRQILIDFADPNGNVSFL